MKDLKTYEDKDKMIDLIRDNYNVLQSLNAFGIPLGFGDKTVAETCRSANVDTDTFVAVVNFTINGATNFQLESLSVPTLLRYLSACHLYFLDYQLPFVRRSLCDAIGDHDEIDRLILSLYDEYAGEIRRHMKHEESHLFPYVGKLLSGEVSSSYSIDDFVRQHVEADKSLRELKDLVLKYIPPTPHDSNRLTSTLYLIYNNEEWLELHQRVEDNIFVPLVRKLENSIKTERVNNTITAFANAEQTNGGESVTERERDVIVGVVQGLSNKEIADQLCISVNTVITHRKNIARKLRIHSPAGLTIYAIATGLVDVNKIKTGADL